MVGLVREPDLVVDVLPNEAEAAKDLGVLNFAGAEPASVVLTAASSSCT
jgi:hypothetical protein